VRAPRVAAVLAAAAAALLLCPGCPASPPETPPTQPVAPAAAATGEGPAALARVIAAERSVAFTGFKRTIHGVEGEGRATRMKVSRDATGRTCLEWDPEGAEARRWRYDERRGWAASPDLLLRNYTVTVDPVPGPAVAWRDTVHLTVRSATPGRPSLDLLADASTWVVLREQFRDCDGNVWLTNEFDSIEYGAPAPQPAGAESLPDAAPVRTGKPLPLAVTSPPAGFVCVGRSEVDKGGVREDWSDGLAAFSVVERPAGPGGEAQPAGRIARRACSGRASVSGVFGGVEVTVYGTLPVAQIEAVVRSLGPAR
jgi:hypothetical protein